MQTVISFCFISLLQEFSAFPCPGVKWSNASFCVSIDLDDDGHVCDFELNELLKSAGLSMPGYKVREIIQNLDRNNDNKISFEEFLSVGSVELTFCSELF